MVGSIEVLKQAIVANGPCIGGLPVKDSTREDFWNGFGKEGNHAVAIVGYDSKGFIIRNSWGVYYGHKGYSHISYDDFKNFIEIWTLI
jgi:C1A family cysteine protease